MTTWILIFYLSSGFGSGATGGPAAIDGFKTKDKCEVAMLKIKDDWGSKFDRGSCIAVDK